MPDTIRLQTPSLPLPTGNVPSYQPLVVPPSDLRRPEGTKEVQTEENPPPKIHFPPLPSITLPSQEVLVAASVTAVTAVAAATVTQPVINALKDKIQKVLTRQDKQMEAKPPEKKGMLRKIKENIDDHDEQMAVLGAIVRLGVVIWSGFIITLNYVELPMVKKTGASSDITFVASIFTEP